MDFANITPKTAPSAWLDLDALDKNIAIVNAKTAKVNLRIASKSVRSLAVLNYIKENTPNYIGIMSYSAEESVYLLENGFKNILCAYPTLDKDRIIKTFDYTAQGAKMVWMIDRLEHWLLLENLAKTHHTMVEICLDINMSMPLPKLYFGTKRSSLIDKKQLKKLLKRTENFSHTKIVGLMGYEAQIAGLPEHLPNKALLTPAIRALKKASKKQVSIRRNAMLKLLKKMGHKIELVNGGGSGSMDFTCSQSEITEITVGSAYYYPALFSYMDSMKDFTPSAGFVLQVTRQPEEDVVTCHSGGFVASGSVGVDKSPIIHYPQNLQILTDEGFGEVQTPIESTTGDLNLKIGDYVWCRHAKAGELCEHFNTIAVYRDNEFLEEISTYRGDGKVFH